MQQTGLNLESPNAYSMSYYPVLLDLEGKEVLVVGGGRVAERKICTLLEYGAKIFLISKEITNNLHQMVEGGKIVLLGSEFEEGFLNGVFLVIAATNDKDLNHRVGQSAQTRGLLVNAVDQPRDCNFIVPSIIRRGDLLIAVSTSGKSPAVAKRLRKELEKQFGSEYAKLLALMGRIRTAVLQLDLPQEENSRIFEALLDSNLLEVLNRKDSKELKEVLARILPETIKNTDFINT